jgi:hypothetical protein
LEIEGSSKCHNSIEPTGVTMMNMFGETKLKSSMPLLRQIQT